MATTVLPDAAAPEVPLARPHRARVPVSVAIVVALLVAAEVVIRMVAPHLSAPQVWGGPEDQVKYEQMKGLARAGVRGGVVFIGSSLTDAGVDPVKFTGMAGLRVPAYDASLSGGNLAVTEWWTTHVVVPILHPRVLVLGVTSAEFNPNDAEAAQLAKEFFSGPAVHRIDHTESTFEFLERKADDWSYLFRYRKDLRAPTDIFKHHSQVDIQKILVTPWGRQLGLSAHAYTDAFDATISVITNRFQVGTRQQSELRSLLTQLHKDGIRVALVDMPVTQRYVDMHPHGATDFAAYQQTVRMMATQLGVPLLPEGIWDTADFADPIHLNGVGAEALSSRLVTQLKPILP